MSTRRTAFFISDRTGITAEMLGQSLLTQFDPIEFNRVTIPFIDSVEDAQAAVQQVNAAAREDGARPIVFSTLVDDAVRRIIAKMDALVLDLFEMFIVPLEAELGLHSSHTVGKSHSAANFKTYNQRIDAINYTLSHDDGATNRNLEDADVILVGVSRSGKTPTCLYLALQFGLKAANYPLIPEDLEKMKLPPALAPFRNKLYGLSITPERLQQIRSERRPDSKYAALTNCRYEVQTAEAIMHQSNIPFIDSTTKSIEELATTILHEAHLIRRMY
ncbi:MAG TPA: pyruvate, water dikinase regulatory protein [Burkholderiales bacterium]|nr:pyruvate, water dikinase regulatory protein [Burkholderiales bacterium]